MKGPLDRTKVVLRHLPPSITRPMLTDQIDPKFSGRYNWLSFFPGNSSQKRVVHSRAYINFHRAEDVLEFAEFFNCHVFVNEKGAQYKVTVEYAPSQHVPKQWSKKDGREGTIFKDPEYLEFLEFIGKPVEQLPSAEIQLERREAEQAANGKEPLIITPLMEFVRQKRAGSNGSRRSLPNGKSIRRTARRSSESPGVISSKRSERRRVTKTMYVMRDTTTTATSGKNESADLSKREDQQHSDKAVVPVPGGSGGGEVSIDKNGIANIGKKKIILLKGKEKDFSQVKFSSTGNPRSNPSIETGGGIIKTILQPERLIQSSKVEKDRQPQPSNVRLLSKSRNGLSDDKIPANDSQVSEKSTRHVRNKERPDRVVWTPLRRSDGSHAGDESSTSASQSMQIHPLSSEGTPMYSSRRRQPHGGKDAEGTVPEGKSSRRGASSSYISHEKKVWVQKSSTSF